MNMSRNYKMTTNKRSWWNIKKYNECPAEDPFVIFLIRYNYMNIAEKLISKDNISGL